MQVAAQLEPQPEVGKISRTATILKLTGHGTSLFLVMVPNVRSLGDVSQSPAPLFPIVLWLLV
jgi:hypothetical protein